MNRTEKFVITVNREVGSGGRTVGRKLAEKLDVKYYDKALIDGLTVLQDLRTGRIPTTYKTRSIYKSDMMYDWINCTYSAIGSLLRMDAMTEKNR